MYLKPEFVEEFLFLPYWQNNGNSTFQNFQVAFPEKHI